ncbi:MAG: hypothetical protein VW405_19085 [Rhodospirillaceae bacterium]
MSVEDVELLLAHFRLEREEEARQRTGPPSSVNEALARTQNPAVIEALKKAGKWPR